MRQTALSALEQSHSLSERRLMQHFSHGNSNFLPADLFSRAADLYRQICESSPNLSENKLNLFSMDKNDDINNNSNDQNQQQKDSLALKPILDPFTTMFADKFDDDEEIKLSNENDSKSENWFSNTNQDINMAIFQVDKACNSSLKHFF